MSDDWKFYPCSMGDHVGSILFDDGIAESLDDLPAQLLRVRIAFKQPREDGMPTAEECGDLDALEDALTTLLEEHQSVYVGRITIDGCRHLYSYTPETSLDVWSARIGEIGAVYGYDLMLALDADDTHASYREELYPDDDSRQVINDLSVCHALAEQGDDGTQARTVEHWAAFENEATAEHFAKWVSEQGFTLGEKYATDEGGHMVAFAHEIDLGEISAHTVSLRRQAAEFGGEYDGWETMVCHSAD